MHDGPLVPTFVVPSALASLQIGINSVEFSFAGRLQRAKRRRVVITWIFCCFSVATFDHSIVLALARFDGPLLRVGALLQLENSVELALVKSSAVFVVDEVENETIGVAVRTRTLVLAGDFGWPIACSSALVVKKSRLTSDDFVFAHRAPMVDGTIVRVGEET